MKREFEENKTVNQYDIYFLNNPQTGNNTGKPVVVISSDIENRNPMIGTVNVVPITRQVTASPTVSQFEIQLVGEDYANLKGAYIVSNKVYFSEKSRLGDFICRLQEPDIRHLQCLLALHFGIKDEVSNVPKVDYESISKDEHEKLKAIYADKLKRKEQEIEDLKEKNKELRKVIGILANE